MTELTSLGRYQLGRVLGRGAMGVVYEGLDPSLNRRVAIKTILKNAAIDAETAQLYSAQFAREAQAAGRLNHPNIVQVHDFAEEGEVAYLVMEFIQGRELRSYFDKKETFEPAEAVRIMGELLDALDFAHQAGVIHRDIKPANVMLDAQRRVKLADFGVARILDSERSAAGTMVGTPAFMSPEQISGGKIDRRTDLFSAGVVFYQLLTGEQPFQGEGAWTVAKKIMQDDPQRPSMVAASVSPVFDGIVKKALAKNPAERFASAKEFAAALRAALPAGAPAGAVAAPAAKPKAAAPVKASEAEVEFWRAIQSSSDPAEFEFYLEQFPEGTYSQLARHKIAKLNEPLEAVRKEAEARARLEAEARARQEAEEQARRDAEERAKREAEERAKQEAEDRAAREADERARRAAAENARREAEERARQMALEKARREAAAKEKREADEKARQAQVLVRLKQQEEAAARAKAVVDEDATVAIGSGRPAAAGQPQDEKKRPLAIAALAAVSIVAGAAGYLLLGRSPPPAPVAQTRPVAKAELPAPAPVKPAPPAVDEEKIRREVEERLRREYAEKSAAEQAAAKAAAEKALAEKILAAKIAAEKEKQAAAKLASDKAAQEKAAADRAAAEKVAAEKAAAERAAAEKIAAEKAVAERAAAEKIAADRAAAEKAAAEKSAAAVPAPRAKPGWPNVGDSWTYEVREANRPNRRFTLIVETVAIAPTSIADETRRAGRAGVRRSHTESAFLSGGYAPGVAFFSPYLQAFHPLRGGEKWSGLSTPIWGCADVASCTVSARVVGRERLSVKAGSFDAWKIEVELDHRQPGATRFVEMSFWFAEEAKRLVKYQMRLRNGPAWSHPDTELELLSYTPN